MVRFFRYGFIASMVFIISACTFQAEIDKKSTGSSDLSADISQAPVNQINQNNITFNGVCSESGSTLVLSVGSTLTSNTQCLENNTWSATLDASSLPDGNITVEITTTEGASLNSITVIKDTTPPTDPSSLSHLEWSDVTTESPILSWTNSSDAGSGISKYLVRIVKTSDSSAVADWQELANGGKISNLSFTLGQSYRFEIKAIDLAENASNIIQSSTFLISAPNSLAFSGNSSNSSTALLRSFTELSSPAWALTGTCNPNNGSVVISGDLDAPITLSCETTNGGSFSVNINNISSPTSPHFAVELSSPLKLGRTLIATQSSSSAETELFETSSSSPPLYISNYAGFKNAPDNSKMILEVDIDLSNGGIIVGDNWSNGEFGIDFTGIIEGNGKKIQNLNDSSHSSASIMAVNSGIVRNLTFESVYLTAPGAISPQKIAAITGTNNGLIEQVNIAGTLHSTRATSYIGGVVAINQGLIKNAKVNLTITGNANIVGGIAATTQYLGGLIGIQKSHAEGTYTGGNFVGGIAGKLTGSSFMGNAIIENCLNEATLSGVKVGGIVGDIADAYHLINKSLSVGSIAASTNGGKLVGSYASVVNQTNSYVKSTSSCSGCTNTEVLELTIEYGT
ncbi:MAG TPA: fibronectin type III domain-containing protein, partial [Pseudobdellovibrionaceae bacterium]|nr:fibronectin type III domain-containing protein [Pseudobdellovibrionaceae bacterium]